MINNGQCPAPFLYHAVQQKKKPCFITELFTKLVVGLDRAVPGSIFYIMQFSKRKSPVS